VRFVNLDIKFINTPKIINEALLILADDLEIKNSHVHQISLTNFLNKIERKHSDDLIFYIQKLLREGSSTGLKRKDIARMPLSRIARKLQIEPVQQKIIFTIDSIETIKYMFSETQGKNWKFQAEKELRKLVRLCSNLYCFGIHVQFIFVSTVHLDLGLPSFLMQVIDGEVLEKKVILML
jgi:hypothetical protein